ncbi:MAG: hypothetical protein MI810_00865 [Flavobacteriales bacterium]|nr:hypothetical protein [Flavobacteriales bacterium]
MAAISCSGGGNLGESFWLPFSESANYLGMEYLGHTHTISEKDNTSQMADFIHLVNGASNHL